jgi:hypothetical protein
MSGNTDDNQRNATSPHPPVPAETAPEVGDGHAVDLDSGGVGGLVVCGGLGGGKPVLVLNPLLRKRQLMVPRLNALLPLQMPPHHNLLLHKVQRRQLQQLVL